MEQKNKGVLEASGPFQSVHLRKKRAERGETHVCHRQKSSIVIPSTKEEEAEGRHTILTLGT